MASLEDTGRQLGKTGDVKLSELNNPNSKALCADFNLKDMSVSEFKIIGKIRLFKSNSRNFSVNGKLPILIMALYREKDDS